ncbi:MAG: roadblock/LC7 domain-containing protein [Candidatus Saliniplasma sp.]
MMEKEEIEDILEELAGYGAYGSAVMNKDGTPIASDLPGNVNENTFSIMCATALGAGRTANSELDRKPLEKIRIDSADRSIIIMSAGRKMVLSAIINSLEDMEQTEDYISKAVKKLRKNE